MKINFTIFFLFFIVLVFAQKKYVLNGISNDNGNSKKIYLRYDFNGITIIKSSQIKNNKFIFTGEVDFSTKAIICTNPEFNVTNLNAKTFYLEPKIIKVKFDFNDLNTLIINGSKTNDEFYDLQNNSEIKKIHKEIDFVKDLYRSFNNKINETSNISLKNQYQFSLDSLSIQLDRLVDENIKKNLQLNYEFIKNNPNSFITPNLLHEILLSDNEHITYDTIKSLYIKLESKVKKSVGGKQLLKGLQNFEGSRVGSIAPDFVLKDMNYKNLKLSSLYKNKFVFIDFWASWCAPCREDLSFLKEIYSNYNNKGIEFISISRDNNIKSWKKAIEKEKIEIWNQISIEENKSNIEDSYFVTAIPLKILINKEGKIIGRWIGSGVDIEKEIKKMISDIFDK